MNCNMFPIIDRYPKISRLQLVKNEMTEFRTTAIKIAPETFQETGLRNG